MSKELLFDQSRGDIYELIFSHECDILELLGFLTNIQSNINRIVESLYEYSRENKIEFKKIFEKSKIEFDKLRYIKSIEPDMISKNIEDENGEYSENLYDGVRIKFIDETKPDLLVYNIRGHYEIIKDKFDLDKKYIIVRNQTEVSFIDYIYEDNLFDIKEYDIIEDLKDILEKIFHIDYREEEYMKELEL